MSNKTRKYLNKPEEITKIGLKIRIRRNKLGWTMMDLSYESGIDYRQIGRIERGETNFTIKTLIRISNALDFNLKELLK
jgi:transcriptional regulator with XRE-family HTH domain